MIDTLKAAFVQGRLAKDEFDLRVGQTFASRTYAELTALTADIPAGPTGARPLRKPAQAQARRPRTRVVRSGAFAVIVVAVATLAMVAGGHGGPNADTQACRAFFAGRTRLLPAPCRSTS